MPVTDDLTRVFAALADPTRRAILSRLAQGPATVGEVAEPLPMSTSAVSQHLKVLYGTGLVVKETTGQWRTLSLRTEPLDEVTVWIERHRRHWNERFDALEERLREMKENDDD